MEVRNQTSSPLRRGWVSDALWHEERGCERTIQTVDFRKVISAGVVCVCVCVPLSVRRRGKEKEGRRSHLLPVLLGGGCGGSSNANTFERHERTNLARAILRTTHGNVARSTALSRSPTHPPEHVSTMYLVQCLLHRSGELAATGRHLSRRVACFSTRPSAATLLSSASWCPHTTPPPAMPCVHPVFTLSSVRASAMRRALCTTSAPASTEVSDEGEQGEGDHVPLVIKYCYDRDTSPKVLHTRVPRHLTHLPVIDVADLLVSDSVRVTSSWVCCAHMRSFPSCVCVCVCVCGKCGKCGKCGVSQGSSFAALSLSARLPHLCVGPHTFSGVHTLL
jgi:hypothetical protein